jgi:hypothetical protein
VAFLGAVASFEHPQDGDDADGGAAGQLEQVEQRQAAQT